MAQQVYLGGVCGTDGHYGIVFPDFLGCVSAGETLIEVVAMGKEALQFHIGGMIEDGDLLPVPSAVDFARLQCEFSDPDDPADVEPWVAVVAIEVKIPTFPNMIAVPIDAGIVREVAGRAQQNNTSSRYFIEQATRRELDRLKQFA